MTKITVKERVAFDALNEPHSAGYDLVLPTGKLLPSSRSIALCSSKDDAEKLAELWNAFHVDGAVTPERIKDMAVTCGFSLSTGHEDTLANPDLYLFASAVMAAQLSAFMETSRKKEDKHHATLVDASAYVSTAKAINLELQRDCVKGGGIWNRSETVDEQLTAALIELGD